VLSIKSHTHREIPLRISGGIDMKFAPTLEIMARSLLAVIFFAFGLNKFFPFIPIPEIPVPAASFVGAIIATGYFFPFLGGVEISAALLLLSKRTVSLALVILSAIIPHIALYLLLLAKTGPGYGMVALLVSLLLFLIFRYKGNLIHLLRDREEG
jgi:putative oxidoreductase